MPYFRLSLVTLLMAGAVSLSAQSDYIVTTKGDTIRGPVKLISYDIDRVQITADGKKKSLPAIQVKTIYLNNEIYVTIKRQDNYQIMKPIKTGYLGLYGFKEPNQNGYTGRFLVKRDGKSMDVPGITFKKSMQDFLGDCDEVAARVGKGDLGRKDVEQMVDLYNACIANRTKAYEKKVVVPVVEMHSNEKTAALDALEKKVEALTESKEKNNALELITDLRQKLGRSQPIPSYLIDGLKSYIGNMPEVQSELNAFVSLVKNP